MVLRQAIIKHAEMDAFNTGLTGLVLGSLPAIPTAVLSAALIPMGTVDKDDPRKEKTRRTLDLKRVIDTVKRTFKTKAKVIRDKEMHPVQSHMNTSTNEVRVPFYGHPALLAHELGHAANFARSRQTVLGRALSGLTDIAYTPATSIASGAGLVGLATDNIGVGVTGVGAAGLLSTLQLVEEARASMKARRILKDVFGDKMPAREYMLPLGAGFGTYLARALSLTGAPIAADIIQERF